MKKDTFFAFVLASAAIAASSQAYAGVDSFGARFGARAAPCAVIANYHVGTSNDPYHFPIVIVTTQFTHGGTVILSGTDEYPLGVEIPGIDITPYVEIVVKEVAAGLQFEYALTPGNNPDYPGACFFESGGTGGPGFFCSSMTFTGNILNSRSACGR